MQEALGIIETLGLATAIQAADTAVKAANVRLGDWVLSGGGHVNIVVRGDVAAVKAAVEAAVAASSQIGEVRGQTVIPRPSESLPPPSRLRLPGRKIRQSLKESDRGTISRRTTGYRPKGHKRCYRRGYTDRVGPGSRRFWRPGCFRRHE